MMVENKAQVLFSLLRFRVKGLGSGVYVLGGKGWMVRVWCEWSGLRVGVFGTVQKMMVESKAQVRNPKNRALNVRVLVVGCWV